MVPISKNIKKNKKLEIKKIQTEPKYNVKFYNSRALPSRDTPDHITIAYFYGVYH